MTIHIVVTQLATLLKNWKQVTKVTTLLTSHFDQDQKSIKKPLESIKDLMNILVVLMYKANAINLPEFLSSSQLDVVEPESYEPVISGPHA